MVSVQYDAREDEIEQLSQMSGKPIVMIDDPLRRTVAGALGAFQGKYSTDIVLLCAGSLLIIAPTIIVFLIFQRQFVRAMLQGAVKG